MIQVLIHYFFYRVIAFPFRLLPIKKRLVVGKTYYGLNFSDSPSLIARELHARQIEGLELVWIVANNQVAKSVPSFIKPVMKHSVLSLYYLYRAHILMDNCRKSSMFVKRKGQFYIQTWHAGIGLKKGEFDVQDKLPPQYVKNAIHDSEIADLFISGSRWQTELYRNTFKYYGEVMEGGLPRNDFLLKKENHKEISKKVRDFYQIDGDTKIALYAPTFRNSHDTKSYIVNYNQIIKTLEKHWKGKWVFLIRMHVAVNDIQKTIQYSDSIKNGTLYNEANDLIIASDLIISDYSSIMYDAILINKRILMYASDLDEYIKNERGLYFHEFPFPLSRNNEQLVRSIVKYKYEQEIIKQNKFLEEIGSYEKGCATQMVTERISKIITSQI